MTTDITTPQPSLDTAPRKTGQQKMRGFTLIELGIVLTIVAILALFAVPRVQSYLISGRVQPTAAEITDAVSQIRNLGASNGGAGQPYVGMTTLNLATALRDRANVLIPTVNGANNSTVQHRLGTAGANVEFAVASNPTAGDSFTLTFNTVNGAACADLAAALQVQARTVTIAPGANAAVSVRAAGGAYNSQLAQTTCTAGDTNTLAFTFQ